MGTLKKITYKFCSITLACALLASSYMPIGNFPAAAAEKGAQSSDNNFQGSKIKDSDLIMRYNTMAGTTGNDNIPWINMTDESFYKALPIGNGRIGAMVYGNYPDEKIGLNEATFWSGAPGPNDKTGAADKMAQAQELEYEGKYTEADKFIQDNIIGGGEAKYQSVGNLDLAFGHNNVTNYSRQLDMNTGVVSCDYDCNGKTYHRESFVSYPDQILVTKISCTTPGSVSMTAKYDCPLTGQFSVSTNNNDTVVMDGHGDDGPGGKSAVSFQTRSKVINTNGTVKDSGSDSISVKDADSVVILTAIRTNFVDYKTTTADQKALATEDITKASAKDYDTLYSNHETDYQNLFKRVDVDLGGTGSENYRPMDSRISDFQNTQDPKLVKVLYQYGRYLMISASRQGGQPMNLQGIWNKFRNPAWDCKQTTNINYEMNYWPAMTTNLAECFEPFVEKAKALSEAGQYTAKNTYGVSTGWVVNHNTDLWNRTAPIDGAWGLWPTGAGWISDQLYDAYNFNQDPSYLNEIYPVIKGSADFLQAFMQKHTINGQDYQVICPSTSPECPTPVKSDGKGASTSYSVTMDNAICRSVFQDVIDASQILGSDNNFSNTLQSKISMIRPDQVGHLGQLQEWAYDWDDPNDVEGHNRHISFAYNLFPGNTITKRSNPTIYDAVKQSLINRDDGGTGWSENWKLNCWARLEDGEHAYKLVKMIVGPATKGGCLYDNLWDAHPPFQIDGNFGFTSGVTEMLLQSQDNEVNLLPALPSEWSTGHANGLCARGGFEVSQAWANGALTGATITSNAGSLCNVRYGSKTISFPTEKGKTYQLDSNLELVDNTSTLTNIALNKTATGSNGSSLNAAKAVDGSAATSWSDLKDNAMSGQWLQLDLGANVNNISRWVVKASGYKNNPRDFTLQKSNDGVTWTDVDAVHGNEKDVNDRNVPTFNTRYVRLLINNATQDNSGGARINELELWGVSTPAPSHSDSPSPSGSSSNLSSVTTTANGNGGTLTVVSTKPDTPPVVSGNRSSVSVTVPSDVASVIASATPDKPAEVKISVPSSDIIGQINNSLVKSVDLTIKAPASVIDNTNANAHIAIDADATVLQAAKDAQKDVTFTVTNSDTGKEAYSWTFSGSVLKNSIAPVGNVNLAMSITSASLDPTASKVVEGNTSSRQSTGLVLKFGNNGLLPGTAQIRAYVGDQPNCTPGSKVYLYYLNHTTNALEQLPQSEYTVDASGYVTFTISHCSDYVLLPKAATNPYAVKCDTTALTGVKSSKTYTFAMTVSGKAVPSFTVGNSKAFVTNVKHVGNKYYVTVRAIGTAGTTTAVYSTLPKQKPAVMDYITIAK